MKSKEPTIIGRAIHVSFPELALESIPVRIDTGAKTSAIWASNIQEKDGTLQFTLFDKSSPYYTGEVIAVSDFGERMVANSFGITQARYTVRLLILIEGRKMRALFTLADRSTQVYPVLVGRNILRGKFIVDVKQGTPLLEEERERARQLKEALAKEKRKGTT